VFLRASVNKKFFLNPYGLTGDTTAFNIFLKQKRISADELIATYFSFCYFSKERSKDLQTLVDFSSFIETHYNPAYSNISAMDTLYMDMSAQIFKWFHFNIVLLSKEIYQEYGLEFINFYMQTFAAGTENNYNTQQVIDILDEKCKGKVNAWSTSLMQAD
jgi:hypothetical protein